MSSTSPSVNANPKQTVTPGSSPENPPLPLPTSQNLDPASLSTQQALALFSQDPVGFIQKIVNDAAGYHLAALKEQAELHGAISAFRQAHPEFQRFSKFILQEAANLLQRDDSVATDSWNQILEKAMDNFKQKLEQTIQENPSAMSQNDQNPPYIEGAGNRSAVEVPPSFTRAQIGKMSMQDFLKNEAAINDALKNNRIQ